MTTLVDDPLSTTDWPAIAASVRDSWDLMIGGTPRSGALRTILSPRDGAPFTKAGWAQPADVDAAVQAARTAFDTGAWPRLHPRERGAVLRRLAELVECHRAELATLISLEMGKPIRDSYRIELPALISCLRFYAGAAEQADGQLPPTVEGELALVSREPAGVVGAVVPWNFPLTLAGWKFAAALAAGCTVVLKVSEQSPISMLRVAELATEAGLPAGALSVLTGDGEVTGRRLGEHPDVDVLTFTGSTAVGRHYLRYSADSNLKRVYLELGGKSPNIILPDAPDLDAAADTAAWAIFFNSGQMCTAGSRLVLHEDIADQVLRRILDRLGDWQPGDPLDPATRIGPLASSAQLDRVLGHLRAGIGHGARLLAGGRRLDRPGSYLEPTVLSELAADNPAVRDEIFGPVLAVQRVRDLDEAIRVAGDTPYGLAAAVWTSDLRTAHRVARRLRAGTVWVNCYEEGDMSVPFGGVKLSGFGRDKSSHALDKFSDLKTTWINYG
ncbi:MAG: aldehyde dehydrogenase family protein [Actinomycetota bacterium]|nr:aldehyde dehydrogenase family protein [Actinomycetota bacterium]